MRTILTNSITGGHKIKLHLNPISNILEVLGEGFSRHYIESRVAKKIKVKALRKKESVPGPWEVTSEDKSLLREIRRLPENFMLENLIIIYANTVAIVSSTKENYGLEIESKEFADTMKSLFDLAWKATDK